MSLYVMLYVEINAANFLMLTIMLIRLFRKVGTEAADFTLRFVIIAMMLFALSDSIWIIGERTYPGFSFMANSLVNALYMVFMGLVSFLWFKYNEEKLGKWRVYSPQFRLFTALPFIAFAAMAFISIRTGWIFYINAENAYRRGQFFFLMYVVTYGYPLIAAFDDLHTAHREPNKARRDEYRILSTYVILPFVTGIVQMLNSALPAIGIGWTVSLAMVYMGIQDREITRDSLTGLNNRHRADEFIENQVNDQREGMVLISGDINDFKRINDTYGHLEGDKALCVTAEAMRQVCDDYSAFLARYGGDEFCVLWNPEPGRTVEGLIGAIDSRLAQITAAKGLDYDITMSFGCQAYHLPMSVENWKDEADRRLYEAKARWHLK